MTTIFAYTTLFRSSLVTDGQVHDAPAAADATEGPPLHALLTGRPGERDRTLKLVRAPGFGIVGQEVEITIRVDDLPPTDDRPRVVPVSIRQDGGPARTINALTGQDETIRIPIERSGTTVVQLRTDAGPDELTE